MFAPEFLTAHRRTGFTLLEMCMVLFIIAILFGVTMPAMQSAFVEQAARRDAHQLALMVKTAMIQSAEQHRPYVIDLTDTTMSLHPMGEAAKDPNDDAVAAVDVDTDADSSTNSTTMVSLAPEDVEVTSQLDPPNQLLCPDPLKADSWVSVPDGTEWVFQPGELCPATRIRLTRGNAWVEMGFNALTGNVENEAAYFP